MFLTISLKDLLRESSGTTHKKPIRVNIRGKIKRVRSLTHVPKQPDARTKTHKTVKNPWGESAPKNLNRVRAEIKHRNLFCPGTPIGVPCIKPKN
jgi:hypothetical protein